jgi:hypothetical protein
VGEAPHTISVRGSDTLRITFVNPELWREYSISEGYPRETELLAHDIQLLAARSAWRALKRNSVRHVEVALERIPYRDRLFGRFMLRAWHSTATFGGTELDENVAGGGIR